MAWWIYCGSLRTLFCGFDPYKSFWLVSYNRVLHFETIKSPKLLDYYWMNGAVWDGKIMLCIFFEENILKPEDLMTQHILALYLTHRSTYLNFIYVCIYVRVYVQTYMFVHTHPCTNAYMLYFQILNSSLAENSIISTPVTEWFLFVSITIIKQSWPRVEFEPRTYTLTKCR